ncbi:hypothetical protein V1477_017938 [Vespula maculifrons]|uniref:Uncharacterized protein n=1 Tax=Vespula maculifrons TaxID=7453 RepID=A0ABD2AZT5_VESMC
MILYIDITYNLPSVDRRQRCQHYLCIQLATLEELTAGCSLLDITKTILYQSLDTFHHSIILRSLNFN